MALAGLLLALTGTVLLGATQDIDMAVAFWFAGLHSPIVDAVIINVSRAGGSLILAPTAVVGATWLSRRRRSWRPLAAVVVGYGATVLSYSLLKMAVDRPRPPLGLSFPDPTSASFPSGHAAQSMLVVLLLVWVARPVLSNAGIRAAALAGLVFTTAVGTSRLYLDVHWVSDVLAGWTLGALWATAVIAWEPVGSPPLVARSTKVVIAHNPRSGSAATGRRAVDRLKRLPVAVLDEIVLDGDISGALGAVVFASSPDVTIAVAGGDGTVGAAAAALAGSTLRLGILPAGTGNDIARALDIPLDPSSAADVVAGTTDRMVDLGITDHGPFVHAFTVGVVATFARSVRDVHGWRRPFIYPTRALAAWRHRRPLTVTVTVDGTPIALPDEIVELAIMNAPRLGGRVGIDLPDATIDDGKLYLLAISDQGLGRWLATEVLRTIAPQTHQAAVPAAAAITTIAGTNFEITSREPLPVCLDGEPAGHTPVNVQVAPAVLRVAVPRRSRTTWRSPL